MTLRRPIAPKDRVALAACAVCTVFSGAWFAAHPQRRLLGTVFQNEWVPWWYQMAAFPPFFIWCASLVLRPAPSVPRLALLASASLIAAVRLYGLIPLSGHVVFLSASLLFGMRNRALPLANWANVLSAGGLILTWFYKWQWGDVAYASLSMVLGLLLGWAAQNVPSAAIRN